MPLWGAVEGTETLPKWLSTAQQKDVFANQSGWVVEAGSAMTGNGNTGADPEILVAIGNLAGLSGTTGLGEATINTVDWNITAWSRAAGGTLSVTVRYNETVTVAVSNPTLIVTNDSRSDHTLTYSGGTGTHELTFTLAIAAANAAIHATDVLSVAAQSVVLASSSTIKDTSTTPQNAELVISAGQGTACGTITAVA
jgi:hypothetical protein